MRKEQSEHKIPAWKNAIVIGVLGLLPFLAGCSPASTPTIEQRSTEDLSTPITIVHMPWVEGYGGIATLESIFIFGSGDDSALESTIAHETGHISQIQQEGGTLIFWPEYITNPKQACIWEKEAGRENHPVCNLAANK